MKITNTLTLIILVSLFYVSAAGTKTKLLSVQGQDSISSPKPLAIDGMFCIIGEETRL